MSPTEATAPIGHVSQSDRDLGPLAWVLDELRKSMDAAVKATRRFVREAEEARDSDLAALDSSPLRMAKQQLHQSSGALDMVGMPRPLCCCGPWKRRCSTMCSNPRTAPRPSP